MCSSWLLRSRKARCWRSCRRCTIWTTSYCVPVRFRSARGREHSKKDENVAQVVLQDRKFKMFNETMIVEVSRDRWPSYQWLITKVWSYFIKSIKCKLPLLQQIEFITTRNNIRIWRIPTMFCHQCHYAHASVKLIKWHVCLRCWFWTKFVWRSWIVHFK